MRYSLPYDDHEIHFDLPKSSSICVLGAHAEAERNSENQETIIRKALEEPINSPRLSTLALNKKSALIITSDHTRPVPSRITLPLLIEEIKRKNPNINIAILVATGLHRATTKSELIDKFGEKLLDSYEFHIHDAEDNHNLSEYGRLPSGGILFLNKLIDESELLIAEGFIEPHFFAGFSGGRKSVLPGVAGAKSIKHNHSYGMINHINSRSGILDGNLIHQDMESAARMADLKFILNVVLDADKKVVSAFAGNYIDAHRIGSNEVKKIFSVPKKKGSIVITSAGGYPLDQNLYQLVKAIYSASYCCQENGVIIAVAGCRNGIGGDSFEKQISTYGTAVEALDRFSKINSENTEDDQWQSQILLEIMKNKKIIICTDGISKEQIEAMKMIHAVGSKDAIEIANTLVINPEYVIIPDGIGIIID